MKTLTGQQKVLYALAAGCVAVGAIFEFCMVGYLMTALVFWGAAGCLALFGLLAGKRTAGARRIRMTMIVLLLVGFGLFLIAEIPVLRDARSDADTSAPYLIVCGAGVNGSVPSRSMRDRLERTMQWLTENPEGTAILSGSQGPDEDLSEAQAMYDWLTDQGVAPARLLMEDRADNSRQNLEYSLALIGDRGGNPAGRVAILSSEYHLHRLGYMARKLDCEPVLVAASTSKVSMFVNYAVREAAAMWKLYLFGM